MNGNSNHISPVLRSRRILLRAVTAAPLLLASLTPDVYGALPAVDPLMCAESPGYLARGASMLRGGNYQGAIDQLGRISTEGVPQDESASEEWLYLLATAYYHTGDSRCEALLNEFLTLYPASSRAVEASLLKGDFLFYAHDFAGALSAYDSISTDSLGGENAVKYNYRRALCQIKCGLYDRAVPLLQSISSDKDYSRAARYYLAYIDYVEGRTDDAYRAFSSLMESDDESGDGSADESRGMRSRRGVTRSRSTAMRRYDYESDGIEPGYYICQILFGRGEWEQTIERGRSLLERRPVAALETDTRRVVGLSYFKLGNMTQSRGYLEDYVREAGINAADDARYALGACLYADGEYSEARKLFSGLTESNDAVAQGALLYLGQIAAKEGNSSSAAINFERAYRMNFDPKVAEAALYDYIAAKMHGGNIPFDTSVDLMEQFADKYPSSEYSQAVDRALAEAHYSQGNYSRALTCIRRIQNPDAASRAVKRRVLYGCGATAVTAGEAQRGASLLQECVEMPGDQELTARAALWLGDARYALGQYARAEQAYRLSLQGGLDGSTEMLADYDLAYALLMQEKFKPAMGYFKTVAEKGSILPADIRNDARMRYADCLYYTGDYTGALKAFTTLGGEGNSPDYATLRRAQLLGVKGDVKEKIRLLESFPTAYPSSRWTVNALTELAETYTSEGMHAKAADTYRNLTEKYPEADSDSGKRLGESYYMLATQLYEKGDMPEALKAYRNLEKYGSPELVAEAYAGIMRTSQNPQERLEYARLVRRSGGLDTDAVEEATLIEALELTDSSSRKRQQEGAAMLQNLAQNPQSANGARAAVELGQYLLDRGDKDSLEAGAALMENFTSSGTPQRYWLARGFILMADIYEKQGKGYLAEEYLRSLRDNYPGKELDIHDMISKRLKRLAK